jgi:hypothetical protein
MTPEQVKQTCEECAQLSLGVNTRAKLEALRDLALKGQQVEAMENDMMFARCQVEAMREAIRRAVEDLKKSDNMDEDAKPMKLIIADLEKVLE